MSQTIAAETRVGEIAVALPGAARVFEHYGIDFCCGGKKTLRQACLESHLDAATLLNELEQAASESSEPSDAHWREQPPRELIDYIVERHHQYVRSEVPRIERWLDKCVAAHGERHQELLTIRHAFEAMATEMAQHMAKEELILFPAIHRLAEPPSPNARPSATCFPSISHPIQMMLLEHEHSGRDLETMRSASGDFTPPPDACATYRALYEALQDFDRNLRRHVHLENNILFPRAIALEQSRGSGAAPAQA
ncbi:MAG: iron-sulfur cluster repair di-iron protein [Terriglobales bacterium]